MAFRSGLLGRVGPRAATAYISVAGDFSPLQKGVAAESAGLSKKGNLLGKAIAGGIGAGLVAGGGLFKIGEAFDAEADKIRVTTGKTGKQLRGLQKDFKAVIKDVPTDFDSAGTAIAGLNQRLGLTGRPLRRLTKQVTELSRITGTDVGENVEAVTRLFGDWSIASDKQSKTLDKLFRASQATGIGVGDLSRLMVQFGSPLRQLGLDFDFSAAMFARFEKEGVNVQTLLPGLRFALKTFSKEGREPAKALRETFEAIRETGSTAKANQIAFETFGVRAGPDMAAAIREGRFDLEKLMRTMRDGKDTVLGAAEDTKDLSERWIEFRNRALVRLEPVATRVFNRVGKEADKLFDILENPRLTTDEKIERISERISDLISKGIEEGADRAAQMAPRVAEAFVTGWTNASVWGRLVLGGWLISKMGGLKAFRALGATAGAATAQGMATGTAAGIASGGFKAKLGGALKKVGIGALVASVLGPDIVEQVTNIGDKSKFLEGELGFAADRLERLQRAGNMTGLLKAARDAEFTARAMGDAGKPLAELGAHYRRVAQTAINENRRWRTSIADMVRDSQGKFAGMRTNVQFNTKLIREALKDESGRGRRALSNNMEAIVDVIRRTMRRGGSLTREGLDLIKQLFVSELRVYGLNPREALAGANVRTGEVRGGFRRQDFQTGGVVVPGYGSGDKVPLAINGALNAMVEPNEGVFVLNRNAMAAMQMFNGMFPRFAAGGIVGLGRQLQRQGYQVGEHPAFGGVAPVHAPNSYHYRGMALDVNWPGANEPAMLDRLYSRLKGRPGVVELLWRVADHFDHLHVALSGRLGGLMAKLKRVNVRGSGPLRDLLQAGMNQTSRAAQRRLNRALGSIEGAEPGVAGGKYGKAALRRLWVQAGGNPGMANLMAAIALAESGGNPSIVNSIGATGLWQIHPGGSQYLNPLTNARTAVMKLRTQGLGAWEAYTNGNYRQFLQRGGVLKLRRGGLGFKHPLERIRPFNRYVRKLKPKPGKTTVDTTGYLDAVVEHFSNQLDARETIARITTPLDFTDDLTVYRDAEKLWSSWFEVARANNDLANIVTIGGLLETARENIKQLTEIAADVTDQSDRGFSAAEALELVRQSELRTAVYDIQKGVFAGLPRAGSFAGGGVVPGPIGAPRAAIVHGGEVITDPSNGGGRVDVHLHFADGMGWLRQFVRVEVRDENRGIARAAGRALPFGGGG